MLKYGHEHRTLSTYIISYHNGERFKRSLSSFIYFININYDMKTLHCLGHSGVYMYMDGCGSYLRSSYVDKFLHNETNKTQIIKGETNNV